MSDLPSSIGRPRELAILLLAGRQLSPRRRARDQQADRAGSDLRRRLLDRLIQLDPEPMDLPAALQRIVHEIGEPTGPTRAIAHAILEEFEAASRTPELVAWLLEQAAAASSRPVQGRNRRARVEG